MRSLNQTECSMVHGASFIGLLANASLGTVVGGVVGLCTGGPPGMVVGAVNGAFNAAGMSIIKEGGSRLYEVLH